MEDQRMTRRHPGSVRSRMARPAAALTAVMVLLAACGGGGGGGNGVTIEHTLHMMVINASAADVTVTYVGAESTDVIRETCTAQQLDLPLADPFQVLIDDVVVIDTEIDMPDGLPNALDGYSDLIVTVTVPKEGEPTFDRIRPGSGLTKPSRSAYCPGLPG